MKIIAFSTVLLLLSLISFPQAPPLQAEQSLGGTDIDHAFDIHATVDGGLIMAGHTRSNDGDVSGNHGAGTFDMWVVKMNKKGEIQWQKPFGGRVDETAFSVQQTVDGGYIVAGEANSNEGQVIGNHGDLDFWVLKLDPVGNIVWSNSLGGSKADFATSITQTKDLGFIVCGGSYSNDGNVTGHHGSSLMPDYWIVKLDQLGNIQWQKSYGGSRSDIAMSIIQSNDGGYLVAGNTASEDGNVKGVHDTVYGDFWILKLDHKGNLISQRTLGGSDYDGATTIRQTKDNGYVTCGWSRSPNDGNVTGNHGDYDFWVVKMDSTGKMQWQKSLGGTAPDLAYSIQQTTDGGYIVSGGTNSNDGDVYGLHGTEGKEDVWVVKLDGRGNLKWQKTLGGSEFEEGRSVDQTHDGGYVIAGFSGWDHPNNGDVTGNHGNYDCWVVKLARDAAISSIQTELIKAKRPVVQSLILLKPNPAHSTLYATINSYGEKVILRVLNTEGQEVQQRTFEVPNRITTVPLDISRIKAGVYYIEIITLQGMEVKKFIKE